VAIALNSVSRNEASKLIFLVRSQENDFVSKKEKLFLSSINAKREK
jgi:hypothetical protein